jgi:hypothetical protein
MNAIKNIIIGVFIAVVAVMALVDSRHVVRYRLTIEAHTPEGVRTGSSVIETRFSKELPRVPWAGNPPNTMGEAVFVDLGTGPDGKARHVIALLAAGANAELVNWHSDMPWAAFMAAGNKNAFENREALHGVADIPTEPVRMSRSRPNEGERLMPTLVTFKDLADPASAAVVPPTADGFAAAFGQGYAFRKARLKS